MPSVIDQLKTPQGIALMGRLYKLHKQQPKKKRNPFIPFL